MTPKSPKTDLEMTTSVVYVLLAVAEEGRHGYAIMREVEERSGNKVRLGPGTLYGILKRLLAAGLVDETSSRLTGENERRRTYRISSDGRRQLTLELERLAQVIGHPAAVRLLKPSAGGGA